jgi:outer membrane protein assembly factor BamB
LVWRLDIPYIYSAERGIDLHVSPTVADGMVFVASNKDYYYGVNATTGDVEWTFVTARGTEDAGEYLVGSMAYHDGKLFIVDMFFITALDATNGEVIWKSWQGTELYTSPTYADDKVYVATDRRLIYVLNASDGKRLSFFAPNSNSWSSPSLYEGRVYIGNNDWNIYCLSDYPVTQGQISIALNKSEVEQGESVRGSGQITPGIAYAPIIVSFVKSDGSINKLQLTAQNDGTFSFDYISDEVGEWTVSIRCSGASYIMESVELPLKVVEKQQQIPIPEETQPEPEQPTNEQNTGISAEQFIIIVVIVIVTLIAFVTYWFIRRRNRSLPIAISD